MKGLKFLASCAVVGAVATACATASFADYTATASYDNGTVTIGIPADYVSATDGDLTLLILSEDAVSITESNKSIVKQIQQGDAASLASVAVGDLADGTYYVRIGGAEVGTDNPNGFIATTFKVGNDDSNPYANSTRKLGDVDGNTFIELLDATQILAADTGSIDLTGEALQAADCDDNGYVELLDATQILAADGALSTSADFTKTVAEKSNYVNE